MSDGSSADTVAKLLQRNAKTWPKRDAMREKSYGVWQTWSWQDYAAQTRSIALGLAAIGMVRGDKLAVIGDNRPKLYASMIAAQSIGGISLAVYQDSIAQELGFVLEHAETRFIIAENQEQVDKLFDIRDRLGKVEKVVYDDTRGLEQSEDPWLISLAALQERGEQYGRENPDFFDAEVAKGTGSDVAIYCYTSGTTGQPKGVMLSHDNLVLNVRETKKSEDLRLGDELLAYLPMAWVGDYWLSIAAALELGMIVNCPESQGTFRRDNREIGPTIVVAPPAAWEQVLTRIQVRMSEADWLKRTTFEKAMKIALEVERLKSAGEPVPGGLAFKHYLSELAVFRPLRDLLGMSRIRKAYTGGAPLGPDVFNHLRAIGLNLKQLYGMTESASACVYQPDGEASSETVGKPLGITEVKIWDTGEILLRGVNIFKGYYKNEEATRETIDEEGWMRSGDAGYVDEKGHLRVIDRAKDVSKLTDGTLFAPQFIENKLKFSPYVREAVTLGKGLDYVAAMVNIDLEALENWAERRGLAYVSYQDLSQKPDVYDLVHAEIRRVNEDLSKDDKLKGAQIKRFLILSKELDADDGEITRTRKIRRGVIADRYAPLIDALYNDKDDVEADITVTYEDGSTGSIRAELKVMTV